MTIIKLKVWNKVYNVLYWKFLTLKCFELIDYDLPESVRADHRDELFFEDCNSYFARLLSGEIISVCYLTT